MPQLDLMTFFTQFFWFSIGFSFFYVFLLHTIMPSIALNLKLRKKKLEFLANDINKKKESASNLLTTYDNILFKTLNTSRNYIIKTTSYGNEWISKSLLKANSINLIESNNDYIKNLAEKSFSFTVLELVLKSSTNDKNWTKLWLNK
uniref:ATP synthase F0 subunit 8 n=1 Tax=Cryptomonas pyrenoidifera TaxID=233184 RepID=UPI00226D1A72|nr:ATP synthase F0 subunit 8 [Cryptomonas pyrenoidifera]UZP15118.1 ATP synthase F0 subunit 8 [Cryptomonas pyrenoidifera]